jgi:hypothetical protein
MKKYGLLLAAIVVLSPAIVAAKEKPEWRSWPLGQRMIGAVGYYKPKLETQAAIGDANGYLGALISFEETLGLSDSKGTAIADIQWRISKRNSLAINYFKLDRSSSQDSTLRVLVPNLDPPPTAVVIDVTLPISAVFNIESVDITYAFSAIFTEKHNLAFGLGLALQNLQFGYRPSENCTNEVLCSLVEPREAKATAPLPTFKAIYQYAINDKWLVDTSLGLFAVDLELDDTEDLDGEIWNISAGILWKTWDHVGFNLGYKYFDVDINYQKRDLIAAAKYKYSGFVLGINAFF